MEQKIKEAYSLQGYLEKKSPAMFKGYQKRYFAMRDNGNLLLYYKTKPKSSETKPQSIVPIRVIEEIAALKGSDTEFIVVIPNRQIQLKAENAQVCQNWIETLIFIKELKAKEDKDGNEMTGSKVMKKQGWSELDKDTMTRIKLEDEKDHYMKNSRKMDTKNDEVMKCKGIYPYVQKFDAKTQDQYIICGFLMKKGKMAKVTMAKRRWFILISSVPINGEPTDKPGPTQNDIPDTFTMNTIYYFKYNERGDKSNYIDKIPADDITNLELMDLNTNDFVEKFQIQKLPYGLQFDYKERTYNFYAENLTDIDKWIKAINFIKNAPKEQKQSQNKQDIKEEIVFEGPLEKKHQNKLLTGPLSWKQVTCTLKKNSLTWAGEKDDDAGNQYVLLIYVKEVVGKNKSFQVFTTDGEEYKFRAESTDVKDKWCQIIQDQVKAIKENMGDLDQALELPPEVNEKDDQYEAQTREEDLEDEETITAKFYKKMALSIEKQNGNSEEQVKKKGFFSKLFCCYGGGEQELEVEKDRGF